MPCERQSLAIRYQRALDYLYSFVDYEKEPRLRDAAHYDLRRVHELLALLGNPHRKIPTVHIAGTKGKGSAAAMVASVLSAAGYRTGLYTSPHLESFNERIRIGERLIADSEIVALTERLEPEVATVNKRAAFGLLTTFEIVTALAFTYFAQKQVDIAVIEVGLGGRLDATNVIQPIVAVITSISYDHMEVLGDTLAEIAAEKAGIVKKGGTVVSAPQAAEAAAVIERSCLAAGARLIRVGKDVTWQRLGFKEASQSLSVQGRFGRYDIDIPLLGRHQLDNAATAVAVLEVIAEAGLKVDKAAIQKGMANVDWPGRLQVVSRRPLIVLDGAHNVDSARKLRQALEEYFKFDRALLILGLSADKDLAGIAAELAPLFREAIVTRSPHPRAMASDPIRAELARLGTHVSMAENVGAALELARGRSGATDLICVTGSLFIVAEALKHFRSAPL